MRALAYAPGRVNLIGDHTDYTGGLVLPMAIDRGTTVELDRGVPWVELISADDEEPVFIHPQYPENPATLHPAWARYVAGVVAVLAPEVGGVGYVRTTLPIGAGLSSSAALEVALALALGFEGTPLALAQACQQAEQLAAGVPCGIMDQLTAAAGIEGHALLIDCTTLEISPVAIPDGAEIIVVDSGQRRTLTSSFYGVRRAQCEDAARMIGPLRDATVDDVDALEADDLRRRAHHVVTENARVVSFVEAIRAGDMVRAGEVMVESHASLRDDFEVSTRVIDSLVERVTGTPGVYGARLTGGGFGGCVVALADRGTRVEGGWPVLASGGATVEVTTSERS